MLTLLQLQPPPGTRRRVLRIPLQQPEQIQCTSYYSLHMIHKHLSQPGTYVEEYHSFTPAARILHDTIRFFELKYISYLRKMFYKTHQSFNRGGEILHSRLDLAA